MASAHIGVVGLAVMGRNLVLNLSDHGYGVAVYNRTWDRTREFLEGEAKGRSIQGYATLADLVAALERPRVVLLMVRAGPGVDAVIDQLLPLLAAGDLIVDGGNSRYTDTERRWRRLAAAERSPAWAERRLPRHISPGQDKPKPRARFVSWLSSRVRIKEQRTW